MINNQYHYEGKDKHGKPIIIDVANLGGTYEVMAFVPRTGTEHECQRTASLEEAAQFYRDMLDRYALKEGENAPLTGRYAKLRDDLKAALKAAEQAAAGVDDGGTCCLDAPSLHLPRWRQSLVEQAAKEAGVGCSTWRLFGEKRYVFSMRTPGQARKVERAAEAATAELARRGYDSFCYQQAD